MKIATGLLLISGAAASLLRAAVENGESRRLSLEEITGYEPFTIVTDVNAIDLDVSLMKTKLFGRDEDDIADALKIYNEGGHTAPFAVLTLTTSLRQSVSDGAVVSGHDSSGTDVKGTVSGAHSSGSTSLTFKYDINQSPKTYVGCQVGGLAALSLQDTSRCLATSDNVQIDGVGSYGYSYNVLGDNKNMVTLAGLSQQAGLTMLGCPNCPHKTFSKFYNYYGETSFGYKWVLAAAQGARAEFGTQQKVVDFGGLNFDARANASYLGLLLLTIYNEVIYQMETAVDECLSGQDGRDHWDMAVAYYSGSLEGATGSSEGVLLHQMADDMCQKFKTCGTDGSQLTSRSFVNRKAVNNFRFAKRHFDDNDCSGIRENKEAVENLMQIPAVQGVLLQAYKRENLSNNRIDEAIGAAYAAAVVPLVHECSVADANTINANMRMTSNKPNFRAVKAALERNYACMKISCATVGGVINPDDDAYYPGAGPCTDGVLTPASSPSSAAASSGGSSNGAVVIGGSIGGVVAFGLILIAFVIWRTKRGKESNPEQSGNAPEFKEGNAKEESEVL